MAGKRGPGRPRKDDAKREGITLRLSADEVDVLNKISRKTGRSRTDILLDGVRNEMNGECRRG